MAYKTTIIRKEHFNAAHRLHNPHWSDEKNAEVFGKCNNPNYHGHNYNLEVKVTGYVDEETGYVMDAKILKNLIRTRVVEKFDHKNLNLDTEEFKNLNPTAENIARVIFEALRKELSDELELKIKLYETERNVVEYPAD
ncbi:MAG: 6-pyruvoyl tetrahydropterin synthase family protein [Fluviicola sp.]